jgi:hypothetical protein
MHHLAQANISCFSAPLDDPMIKEFVDVLKPENKLAKESPGFLWRLKDEEGRSASHLKSPFKNEMIAINISVWEGMKSFKSFVYGTVYSYSLKNKKKWFDLSKPSQFIMWWIPAGEVPSLELRKEKLEPHQKHGDTPQAFSMRSLFDAQGNSVKLS